MKRKTIKYDKSKVRTCKAIRNAVVDLGFDTIKTDKNIGILKFKTKKKYLFFGGTDFTITANEVSERDTEVTISTEGDISKSDFQKMANNIFNKMDKELPIESA